jgi:hypothetical protein
MLPVGLAILPVDNPIRAFSCNVEGKRTVPDHKLAVGRR